MDYFPTADTGHKIDLDLPTGTEFIAGSMNIFGPEFFVEYAKQFASQRLYMQLEFEKNYSGGKYDLSKNLCTIYAFIEALSIALGREITFEERLELARDRYDDGDFDPSVGGFTSMGVDTGRRWHNTKFADDPIITQMINDPKMLEKLAGKNIPLITSLRGNRQFSLDTVDGVMDQLNYWDFPGARYGHARCRFGLKVPDNYMREYRYKRWADLKLCMDKGFESRNCFIIMKESWLTDLGKKYLKGQRAGLFNGERPDDVLLRQDAVKIVAKKWGVSEEGLWNKMNGLVGATKYEWSVMNNRASGGNYQIYNGLDKNKFITRGGAILTIVE